MSENPSQPSRDAFLDGAFEVYQPTGGNHRAGMDALLLAGAVPVGARGKLIDLGAGSGVAGLACLATAEALTLANLVEINSASVALLRRSHSELLTPALQQRVSINHGDVCDLKAEGAFDWAICNPPFNGSGYRVSPNSDRAIAHQAEALEVGQWVDVARGHLKSGGNLAMIFRPDDLGSVLHKLEAGQGEAFGNIRVLPICPREGEPANRIVLKAIKGRKTPLTLLPPFPIHRDGNFTDAADSVFKGRAKLPI
jgi:tRNA1(Val) A37 N6-methylase TrmN6